MIKKKPPPSGAPDWVLTYGDMMSLLLCFFILLAAFADYEEGGSSQQDFRAAIDSIHESLGVTTPGGNREDPAVEFNAIISQIRWALQRKEHKTYSNAEDQGMKGKNFRLRRIRDGLEVTIGGPILFNSFSSDITAEGREMIDAIAGVLKGHRNMCEVRGHAADQPAPDGWRWDDAVSLSYLRAKHVADALVSRGVEPRSMRLVSCGPNEPVPRSLFPSDDPGANRRVEIIVRESVLDDYAGQKPVGAPATTQPADTMANAGP